MAGYTDSAKLKQGMEVVGSDGTKVGKIASLDNNQIVVEKGFFFPSDYAIPMSAVASVDNDKAYLSVTKDQALHKEWGAGSLTTRTSDATAYAAANQAQPVDTAAYADQTTRVDANQPLIIDVREEELTATKHAVDAGNMTINKTVVSEERTLDVPITEERVNVTRRNVDREDAGDATAFQEGTIEIPLHTEQVDLEKRVRVGEEVEVAKEAVQKTQQVTGTVRREVVNVTDTTQGNVRGDMASASSVTDAGKTSAGSLTDAAKAKGLLDRADNAARDAANKVKNKSQR